MAKRIGIGDRVEWDWSTKERGGKTRRGTIKGTVVELNPSIAPGTRYGIKVRDEEGNFYPLAKVRRSK